MRPLGSTVVNLNISECEVNFERECTVLKNARN